MSFESMGIVLETVVKINSADRIYSSKHTMQTGGNQLTNRYNYSQLDFPEKSFPLKPA
jgi:hypothetical protein